MYQLGAGGAWIVTRRMVRFSALGEDGRRGFYNLKRQNHISENVI